MIVVTGATGKLGSLVVDALLQKVPAEQVAVAVRTPSNAARFSDKGAQVRHLDYAKPETLRPALAGAAKVLLISSNDLEQRLAQHYAVVDAAKAEQVPYLVYTSMMGAETARMELAKPHQSTERRIRESGLAFTILRNGWYIENHTEALGAALAHGAILGAAGDGRFASASRSDLAEAAAAVLAGSGHENKTYELPGDAPYTLAELAAVTSQISGKTVTYRNLPQADYAAALVGFGLPPVYAGILADADAWAAKGELDAAPGSGDLRALTGHASTTLADAVRAALAG